MNSTPEKQSNGRIFLVYSLLFLFGLVCLGRILVLGMRDRSLFMGKSERCLDMTDENWDKNPLAADPDCNCFLLENEEKPRRGDIYDDQGRVLASTVKIYDITIDGRTFREGYKNSEYLQSPARLDSLVDVLAAGFYNRFKNKFDYGLGYYKTRIGTSLREGKNVVIIRSNLNDDKRWITEDDKEAVKKMPLLKGDPFKSGLNISEYTARINPYGELAKRSIGRKINDRWNGLEFEMDTFLRGINGSKKKVNVSGIDIPLNERIHPVDGSHIHTTLNLEIQNIVHNELLNVLKEYEADWGCAVVMETRTGEVKAITNLTADASKSSYQEDYNYVVNFMLEPGSTFKLASLLAYLERSPNDSAKKYPILSHQFTVTGKSGKEYRYLKQDEPGKVEAAAYPIEAFQRSSNVGIASMIFDRFSDYKDYLGMIDSLYITTSFSTQLGKVKSPNIKRNARDFHSYYNACFGTGFKMAPIQSLIYFNAVANDGKMIVPFFVRSVTHGKDTLRKYVPEVITEQMCKPETIRRAKEYLESVVTGPFGTARRFRNSNFTFAGKTGTRDIWDEESKSYDKYRNCVSFCGYFPAEEPKYTCVIYIYNVPKKSSIAVEAFTKIARNILNVKNYDALKIVDVSKGKKIPSTRVVPVSQLTAFYEALDLDYDLSGIKVPYVLTAHSNDGQKKIRAYDYETEQGLLPNVMNMPAASAVYELSKAGYKAEIEGKGFVKKQSPPDKNNCVRLILGS